MLSGALKGFSLQPVVAAGKVFNAARGVVGFAEQGKIFAAHRKGDGVDHDDGLAESERVFDDVRCAAFAARGLTVPQGEQHIATVHRFHAAVEVGVFARTVLGDDAHVLGRTEHFLHRRPVGGREIRGEIRAWQRQDRVPREAEGPRLLDKYLVAADGDGRERDPFARRFLAQRFQRSADDLRDPARIRELPMSGKSDDMKQRQLAGGGGR